MDLYDAIIEGTPEDFVIHFPTPAWELRDRVYAVMVREFGGGFTCSIDKEIWRSTVKITVTPFLKQRNRALSKLFSRLNDTLGKNVMMTEWVSRSGDKSMFKIGVNEWWNSATPLATFEELYNERLEAV